MSSTPRSPRGRGHKLPQEHVNRDREGEVAATAERRRRALAEAEETAGRAGGRAGGRAVRWEGGG